MTANNWFCNASPTSWANGSRSRCHPETTALGAAFLAGQASGFYGSQEELERAWVPSRAFDPAMGVDERGRRAMPAGSRR